MNKQNKITSSVNIAYPLLNSMTRDELRASALSLGVPRGRNRTDTIDNLVTAIQEGKAGVKMVGTLTFPRKDGQTYSRPVFIKKLRTYKSDKVLQPVAPAPQS